MTKEHKNNYCKRANKSKLSLKRRLQSVYYSFSSYFTFLVFEVVTPWLSFKGKVVLEASSIIWWFGQSPVMLTSPRLAFQLAGLVCGTANPQSPYGRAGRGVSSSPLAERSSSCPVFHWVQAPAECYGDLVKMEKCGSSWPESGQILAVSEAPIFPEDSSYNHWHAWLCSPKWDCPEHLRISEM